MALAWSALFHRLREWPENLGNKCHGECGQSLLIVARSQSKPIFQNLSFENQQLAGIRSPIDDVARMVNETADSTMLFHAKMAVAPNFADLSPHSHSIVYGFANTLNLLRKIFWSPDTTDLRAVK